MNGKTSIANLPEPRGHPVARGRELERANSDALTSAVRSDRGQTRVGLPQQQRHRAMLVVLTGLSMSVLDGVIANIALPTIAAELQTDPSSAVWVVNAYQLAVTISLLPFASLGELRDYRRVFVWGLAIFTVGSLACALSSSLTVLVASRILQGFGGA